MSETLLKVHIPPERLPIPVRSAAKEEFSDPSEVRDPDSKFLFEPIEGFERFQEENRMLISVEILGADPPGTAARRALAQFAPFPGAEPFRPSSESDTK